MSGGVYGGDEVGALVFDAGHYTFRAGYAGEEFPKADIPSQIGVLEKSLNPNSESLETDENRKEPEGNCRKRARDYLIGKTQIYSPRENMEIETFLKDGMLEDWDMFESLLDHMYSKCLFTESSFHPVLFSEPAWNIKSKREKLIELMFEKYNVPAFYICKNAVLAAFANGRSSGLILDSGATHTSAIPVYDGYCLTHAVVKTPFGGNMLSEQFQLLLDELSINIIPTYKVASKTVTNENEKPKWTMKSNLPTVTESYEKFMIQQVLEDMHTSNLQLSDTPIDIDSVESLPTSTYEFPCGYTKDFHAERVRIPEGLFDLSYVKHPNPQTLMTVRDVASTSIGLCDIDIRPSLYSGLIVTGGNSLMQGFVERLNHDLSAKCPPSCKLRITSAPTPSERRYGAWIGGSILASLGSFQQMWVSRQDFDETGKSIVDKKCP